MVWNKFIELQKDFFSPEHDQVYFVCVQVSLRQGYKILDT